MSIRKLGLGVIVISRPLIKIEFWFFSVHFPLIYEHLFCKYFFRQSVGQAKKGINVKMQKRGFLGCFLNPALDTYFLCLL